MAYGQGGAVTIEPEAAGPDDTGVWAAAVAAAADPGPDETGVWAAPAAAAADPDRVRLGAGQGGFGVRFWF